MARARYVAFLRGINVGGRNIVSMRDLRAAFEDAGLDAVRTYIQSGNVLFESTGTRASLESSLEKMLERRFELPLTVVLRSYAQLRAVVAKAPTGFGQHPDRYHSDVVFLKAPLTSAQVMRVIQLREDVDQAWPGTGVVYFARLSARRAESRMSRIVAMPEYKQMTIRNWATTTKLLALLDAPAPS